MCSWLYSMELFERTSSVPSKSHIYSVASRRVCAEGACAMSAVEALGGVVCIVGTVGTVLESMSQSVANECMCSRRLRWKSTKGRWLFLED